MNKAQILQKRSDKYQGMGQDGIDQFNPILCALEHPESKKKAIAGFSSTFNTEIKYIYQSRLAIYTLIKVYKIILTRQKDSDLPIPIVIYI